jgi:hypothetical protein
MTYLLFHFGLPCATLLSEGNVAIAKDSFGVACQSGSIR